MSGFESRGVELQMESTSRFQAQKRFEHSCDLCCNRGLRIECDRCSIRSTHETLMGILDEIGLVTKPRVQIGFGF